MAAPDAQAQALDIMDRDIDQGLILVLDPDFNDCSVSVDKAAEVRLPILDERQPFLEQSASDSEGWELFPKTNSDHQSSFTHPSSSSSRSSSPQQLGQRNDVSSSQGKLNPRDNPLSLPNELTTKDGNPSTRLAEYVRKPFRDPFPSSSGERGDPRNQGIKVARQRFQQEKAARRKQAQQTQEAGKTSEAIHQSSEATSESAPRTLRQSKPVSTFDRSTKSITLHKPVVRLPGQPSTMQPNGRAGSAPNSSSPYGGRDGNNLRPLPPPSHGLKYQSNVANSYSRTNQTDWTTWQELSIRIVDIPANTTTRDLWKCFSKEGTIIVIELYENSRGQREGKAHVRFSPPPAKEIWKRERFSIPIGGQGIANARIYLESRKRTSQHTSPVDAQRKYEEVMALKASSLDFGMMLNQMTLMNLCTVLPTPTNHIHFRLSMLRREITVEFLLHIRDQRTGHTHAKAPHLGKNDRKELFQFRIPFSQLEAIQRVETKEDKLILLISLETPPSFFKRLDANQTHDDNARYWGENDAWYRQTDVVYAHSLLKRSPLTLKKTRPVIDLGRWTTYRLVFEKSNVPRQLFDDIRQALQDYNIDILPFGPLNITEQLQPSVWEFLDKPLVTQRGTTAELIELTDASVRQLAFQVRYQLEVCISNGYLNEHNLDQMFLSRLMGMDVGEARDLLEYVANQGKRVFDPMPLFNIKIAEGTSLRAKIPHYCVYIRAATVTPTTVYFQTPIPETSNRVIRKYSQYADRFLRVRFTEEKTEGKIYATDKDTMNEVFTRVKRVLTNGIFIGDRKYEFLACGNAQFREHGAYFFAPLPHLPTERIRDWMGMFKEIKTVPLYLARLGQCFSTTRAIQGAATEVREMEDIARNGYVFSDGVGKISPLLARVAALELGILQQSEEPPSVFQIRAGGCKGILATWPTPGSTEIYIRRSQYKFPAKHDGLEIIRWSQYACANLNRQIILILSALGVPDKIFSQKLRLQLSNLERAMTDEKTALAILQKDIDHNQMTLVVASMILDGFQNAEEPFLISLLHLWRAWSIKYLKEKARITIGGGALLLGCMDETATLEGHYDDIAPPPIDTPINEKVKYVPEVFVQLSKNSSGKPEVVLGPMLLARNPSLHPGDIRLVCGVDVPELHHLKDVVVLPQTGDRDVASMCSGGDLDGDDFLVIWDEDLLPVEWNLEPMDYSRPPMVKHGRNIGIDDLTTFFVTYMKNDNLCRIAQAHLANADYLEEGVKDERCLRLANLHSMAVDYVKTGQPAQMPRELRAPKRPHFMENTYQRKENTYVSQKVLGQLYDQVERIDFVPLYTAPFDGRILKTYKIDEGLLANAREIKQNYDAHMRRIMAQHEIKTEFEVWSTFVLDHSRITNDFKFHEQIGQLSAALKDQFRAICYEKAGGKSFQQIGPFAAAMYKVTAAEITQAVQECNQTQMVGGPQRPSRKMTPSDMPLMSFPWLFQNVLGRIAMNSAHKVNGNIPEDAPNARDIMRSTYARRARGHPSHPTVLNGMNSLETAEGNTQLGDMLELFEDSHI